MSLNITIPKSDLAKGIPIANGWAEFEIVAAVARPSKAGDSVNYVVTHKLCNDINERELDHNFSSKALGMMAPWIGALANKPIQEILDSITTGSLSFDLEQQKDKHIMGKVEQQMYEGRIVCKLVDFAPVGKVPF